jgi:hypothetical protein
VQVVEHGGRELAAQISPEEARELVQIESRFGDNYPLGGWL